MNFKYNYWKLLLFCFFILSATILHAQSTDVSGTVTDAVTKKPLPFVVVSFPGTSYGVNTDNDGNYSLSTTLAVTKLKVSFLGYKDALFTIKPGADQVINVRLIPTANQLQEVTIRSGKKPKYRNKDNPAVELIRKVIENREKNRPESYSYVEYKEYDKMQFSFANLKKSILDKKWLQKYNFVLQNRDSTTVPGTYLTPVYLDEKLTQYYYRKQPEKEKTITLAQRSANFGPGIDSQGLTGYMKHMYYKVDIYSNVIFLMTTNFLSPIANSAPTFYKYFITDTLVVNNQKLVELSFTPRNLTDVLFVGKLYVTLDGNYAVQKADLTINKNINLNFVNGMSVNLEFEQNPDGKYHLSKSTTIADFGLSPNWKGGLFGVREIAYGNYIVNKPEADTTYRNQEDAVPEAAKNRTDDFWQKNRIDTLTTAESKIYKNTDSLRNMPSFKRTVDLATLLIAGYKDYNTFEIGPANAFYSYNPIEGVKLRFGGRTTPNLSKRYYFETYAAYGFKDQKWKGFLSATYSLNNKSIYKFPQNYIRASVQYDTYIPGSNLQFVQEDNLLLSIKRGDNDKYIYDLNYKLDYMHEYENHFSYEFILNRQNQSPAGSLYFNNLNSNGQLQSIHNLYTTDFSATLRYAPNEQFYQGKIYRVQVPSKNPVFTFNYDAGLKNVLDGQYGYQRLSGRIDKRFYLSQLGWLDATGEAGHLFGQVPYPLLDIFHANQTYSYQIYSYNLMNFLEFVADHYESISLDQHFNGFFFNKIPLLKKLHWRETASFKSIWGGLSNGNNPLLHPNLYQFPVTATGQPITNGLGPTPYIEGSVGIENIFKFVRVDLVRRFTYLNNPDVAKWGIRTLVQFNF
ncbi:DUF5686 family protein [Mucilaginibacter sp.]|uniref:DUF5686 and carboxypeptidase-like regulatory domain-containing protein n=1 Tax=Mucilaginibacter sp. TaxID=1882438 RepID=UPI00284E7D53|nr:DUF5686 family protein [Mucilaginibacter sp.]MDR3694005.1 DUF5686 family protein [Mucilaginibacter sp.]